MPGQHGQHVDTPSVEMKPDAQEEQEPPLALNLPAGHASHHEWSSLGAEPGQHLTQLDALPNDTLSPVHALHDDAPTAEYVPAAQDSHVVWSSDA